MPAIAVLCLLVSTAADAYLLPPYEINGDDEGMPAEDVLSQYESQLAKLGETARPHYLEGHRQNYKQRLTQSERNTIKDYDNLKVKIKFWRYVVDLKHSIMNLPGTVSCIYSAKEADAIAKTVVATVYNLSQEYRVTVSAWIQNYMVNHGMKDGGHCYQYVERLLKALSKDKWGCFDLHWGEAYAGTFRENNALVITAKGMPFREGLAIDAWRTAGKPFWREVEKDRFPWTEASRTEASK